MISSPELLQTLLTAPSLPITGTAPLGLLHGSPAPQRASYVVLEGKHRVSGARQPPDHAGTHLAMSKQPDAAQPQTHGRGAAG